MGMRYDKSFITLVEIVVNIHSEAMITFRFLSCHEIRTVPKMFPCLT